MQIWLGFVKSTVRNCITPNKYRTAGSQRKMGLIFSSGQKIRTQDSWVGSANATSVVCPQLDFVNCDFFPVPYEAAKQDSNPWLCSTHPPLVMKFFDTLQKAADDGRSNSADFLFGLLGIFWSKAGFGCKKGPESAEPDLGDFFYSIRFDFRPNICGCFCFFQASRSFR